MVHFQDESYALRECICLKQVHHQGMTMNGEKKGIEKTQKKSNGKRMTRIKSDSGTTHLAEKTWVERARVRRAAIYNDESKVQSV